MLYSKKQKEWVINKNKYKNLNKEYLDIKKLLKFIGSRNILSQPYNRQ